MLNFAEFYDYYTTKKIEKNMMARKRKIETNMDQVKKG